MVSEHIDDVEALGDIGWEKKTEIGRVLARNRSLCVLTTVLLLIPSDKSFIELFIMLLYYTT